LRTGAIPMLPVKTEEKLNASYGQMVVRGYKRSINNSKI